VTHELRIPLTILRGETELALRGDKSADELRQIINSNLEEISRMAHLVDDLLLLSKSEQGEIPLKMEALNLNELLEELHFQGKIIAEPKQIMVELKGPEKQVSLLADPNRIRQVFLNLLTNGIKYTPEGGRVTINWALQEESVRIIFEDTGIGIESAHQQHIFDRFYRINKTGNRNDGGSGLGLAIAKWLVEAHGGSIMVCSEPGQGSSFAILLPLTRKPVGR
jgi:signal transduction histidine kinase